MNKNLNELSLTLKKNLILEKSSHKLAKKYQAALIAEISQLGFSLDSKVLEVVATFSQKEFESFSKFLIEELKKMVGAHVRYTPLFKGFPTDVPDQDEYFMRRIAGFLDTYFEVSTEGVNATRLSCGCLVNKRLFDLNLFGACPICQFHAEGLQESKIKRKKMRQDIVDLKVIGLMTEDSFKTSIKDLLSSPASLAPKHKEVINSYFTIFKDEALASVPASFNFKETMAETAALIVKHTWGTRVS